MDTLSFFEITPDLVCVAGEDGFFKNINQAVADKLEYSKEELFARPIISFVHPGDQLLTQQTREKLVTDGGTLINFENRYISKSGKIIWLYWTSLYIPDKRVVFAIAKDITERKQLQKEMEENYHKFKSLASHFKSNIEKERKSFAWELHEELAQLASVIKLDLDSALKKLVPQPEFVTSRLAHAIEISELLIQKIRKISLKISPHLLDDLGLNEAIDWICSDFTSLTGIPCLFKSDYTGEHISHEIKIDFFRICQEALSNVMNHADASSVKISLKETEKALSLSIVDDGKGFDIQTTMRGAGLSGIYNRVASINGRITIDGATGKGTHINIKVSIDKSKAQKAGLVI